jgi:hypothetical protein
MPVRELLGAFGTLVREQRFLGFTLTYSFISGASFVFVTIGAALFETRFKALRRRRLPELFDIEAITPSRIAPIAASVRSGVLNLRDLTPCAQLSVFGELRARYPISEEKLDRLMTEWLMRLGATRHTLQ